MAEYIAVNEENVNLNDSVTFTNSIPCTKGYIFHEDGTGVFTFRGITNNCFARYQVTFNGNIAVPTGGTAGPIAVAISVDGEQRPSSRAIVTPAAVEEYNNVTSTAIITVPSSITVGDRVPIKVNIAGVAGYAKLIINGEEMISGAPYWFKVEPIEWTVLKYKNGDYTLVSDRLLEQTNFDNRGGSRIIDTKTIYENNYEYSSIRDWLNSSFQNKLFFLNTGTDYHVIDTVVDNSAKTTGSEWNDFACNNTIDKLFLPSVLDTKLIEEKYGNYASLTTDYLRASGTYYNYQTMPYCAEYWTRSPDRGLVGPGSDPTFKDLVQFVSQKGDQGRCSASLVHNIRPCVTIKVI